MRDFDIIEELSESGREGWEVLELPAVAEEGRADALDRAVGEALCPELGFDAGWARRTKAAVGGYWWASLYQQRPRPAEGMVWLAGFAPPLIDQLRRTATEQGVHRSRRPWERASPKPIGSSP